MRVEAEQIEIDKGERSLWLPEEELERLKGIGHTTLIRMWVEERLKDREQNANSPQIEGRDEGAI